MTEQQRTSGSASSTIASGVATDIRPSESDKAPISRLPNGAVRTPSVAGATAPALHWRGQDVLRIIIVLALIVLGFAVGYQVGEQFVSYIYNTANPGGNAALANLALYFRMHQFAAITDVFLFAVVGGLIGFLLGTSAYAKISALSENFTGMRANEKVAIFVGVAAGLFLSVLLAQFLTPIPKIGWLLTLFVSIILVYICTGGTLSMKESFDFFKAGNSSAAQAHAAVSTSTQIKILDTNVIIDGRVSDVCRTGFIEGEIYVPGFVLDELQHIADSSDSLKRARGRRGLDILNAMNATLPLQVRSLDTKAEYAPHEEVDSKLVKLAKQLQGAIVTNDFNLNKVAELQGVEVLNINELANALKPVVLPGEEMRVIVIKEGKEMNQGVGYLDDGTMIVIEGARRRIGETLDVVVASVLQTNAGKMIFAAIKDSGYDHGSAYDYDGGGDPNAGGGSSYGDQGSRPYPGSRPRRPLRDR